ncbi:tetratricopeptide repeat protein [Geomonas sp. Red32]|uniref:O-linked N-acetylglucosamine transferase family protein n=1 Tax=Geomonas sp. Red32 TaxID=2912856 RepID=UPI00202D087C|nr:tetratricopeptide repeat protein [Geomonas sp. Red32]MCM0081180.1 tetratricopeptide repeat protein [Geomonas sp. Red32]
MAKETAEELFGKGNRLYAENDLQAAASCYLKALEIDPGFAAASFNLGCTLDRLHGPADALPYFQRAAALRPEWGEAHQNAGFALARLGRMTEAVAALQAACRLKPLDPGVRNNLALALSAEGKAEDAYRTFRDAIRLDPGYPEAYNNLGVLCERHGRISEAIDCCERALSLRPGYPEAHNNLANAFKAQGRHREAIEQYRAAIAARPDYHEAHSSLLFALCYPSGIPEEEVAAEHFAYGALLRLPAAEHRNTPDPARIVTVGYLSADFRSHAVARFIEPVLRHHDRSRFRIVCYSNVAVPDEKSAALAALADRFVNIAGVPDAKAEEMIRNDGIDILVDLCGHTADNRLPLLARKPAPVQVSWLGYPHTTGLAAVDYRLTDPVCDPPGLTERYHTETLVRLPAPFLCFAPPEEAPEEGPLPAQSGRGVRFGSFNNPAKITVETVALWAGVLKRVPGSTLLVKGYSLADERTRERLCELFAAHRVSPDRLTLRGNTPGYREHLALYHEVDIALDTYPYHGTTTTCEALWMGVPVVTLAGATHRSRVGVSLFQSVGLGHLVAENPERYQKAAAQLAGDLAPLAELRKSLRSRMAASELTDGIGFTYRLEEAYAAMWRTWCGGRATPSPPVVPPRERGNLAEAGDALLREAKLDQALQCYLELLRTAGPQSRALPGIQETLDRQTTADLAAAVNRDAFRLRMCQSLTPIEPVQDQTLLETAELLMAAGFITPAELICRYLQDRGYPGPAVSVMLGEIALLLGQPQLAVRGFGEAQELGDHSVATRIRLLKAEESARLKPPADSRQRFLLIKAWGYGFWSDVNHVIGQLLLAEITGRIPVVQWGGNSLFSDDPSTNAFESFFEPISRYRVEELAERAASFYPPKWNARNLTMATLNQADGPWSRFSSLHALDRNEEVVVGDFHYGVHDLTPWIPPGHQLYGLSSEEVSRDLCRRYLKVKPWIAAKAECFYREKMAGQPHLALHVRGGDKGGEDPNLTRLNTLYHSEIERHLRQFPNSRLYLMTDDREILDGYLKRYGERVITTGATRTDNSQGVHYQRHLSRYRIGEEVIVDTLLALRCEAFIGNGLSNVSCAVAELKEWEPGALRLLGARLDRLRQITLYRN